MLRALGCRTLEPQLPLATTLYCQIDELTRAVRVNATMLDRIARELSPSSPQQTVGTARAALARFATEGSAEPPINR
ncbi:MAG: hypothetical protein ACKODA_08380 [Nevskiaceae bacterium]